MIGAPFGEKSQRELATANVDLQRLFNAVAKYWNCTIIDGVRTVEQQAANVARGLSKTMNSRHLPGPDGLANAVDVAPYPQRWEDPNKPQISSQWEVDQIYFAGFVVGVAASLNIPIRWGGDWNSDLAHVATGFLDLDHFETPKG